MKKEDYRAAFNNLDIDKKLKQRIISESMHSSNEIKKRMPSARIIFPTVMTAIIVLSMGMTVYASVDDAFKKQVMSFFGFSSDRSISEEEITEEDQQYELIEKYMVPIGQTIQTKDAEITLNGYVSDGRKLSFFGSCDPYDDNVEISDTDYMRVTSHSGTSDAIISGATSWNAGRWYDDEKTEGQDKTNKRNFVIDVSMWGKYDLNEIKDIIIYGVYRTDGAFDVEKSILLSTYCCFDIDVNVTCKAKNLIGGGGIKIYLDKKNTDYYYILDDLYLSPLGVSYSGSYSEEFVEKIQNNEKISDVIVSSNEDNTDNIGISSDFVTDGAVLLGNIDDMFKAVLKDGTEKKMSEYNKYGMIYDISQIDRFEYKDEINDIVIEIPENVGEEN